MATTLFGVLKKLTLHITRGRDTYRSCNCEAAKWRSHATSGRAHRTQAKPMAKPPETVQFSGIQQCSEATPGIAPASAGCGRVRHFMWLRSRYRRSHQYKWGTGMCLGKKMSGYQSKAHNNLHAMS